MLSFSFTRTLSRTSTFLRGPISVLKARVEGASGRRRDNTYAERVIAFSCVRPLRGSCDQHELAGSGGGDRAWTHTRRDSHITLKATSCKGATTLGPRYAATPVSIYQPLTITLMRKLALKGHSRGELSPTLDRTFAPALVFALAPTFTLVLALAFTLALTLTLTPAPHPGG